MTKSQEAEKTDKVTALLDFFKKGIEAVTQVFADELETPVPETQFFLTKGKDGRLNWFARYSNKYRDDDVPTKEIISSSAHREFVEAVDNGEAELPELWLWHNPAWKFGKAKWVAYDESGFSLAGGLIDEGCEDFAYAISGQENVLTSHGMLASSIERDQKDKSIITKYRSVEISPLPQFAAANKITGWGILDSDTPDKETMNMSIPQAKREKLSSEWGLSPDFLDKIEALNESDAQEADAKGIESKEVEKETAEEEKVETNEAVETETEEEVKETEQTEAKESEDAVVEDLITRQELADAIVAVFNPILTDIKKEIITLAESIEATNEEIVTLKEKGNDRIEDMLARTPPASIAAMIQKGLSVVGSETAKVDKEDELAKNKPRETEDEAVNPTHVPFINQMLADGK